MFQSPSLRGSGRFSPDPDGSGGVDPVSIPFIAGQWSLQAPLPPAVRRGDVSIPFIAGQWSLLKYVTMRGRTVKDVSIPFIAGQWSLQSRAAPDPGRRRVSIPFIAGQWSLLEVRGIAYAAYLDERFNPLHCGAVVASRRMAGVAGGKVRVSIPFIAGQWSLRKRPPMRRLAPSLFQSPSLRGSGRFFESPPRRTAGAGKFQSPSLRGSGRF